MSPARQSLAIVGLAVLAGAAGMWAGSGWDRSSRLAVSGRMDAAPARLTVGDALPDIRLPDNHGRLRALNEWRGRPLLINFWASWCRPCIEEMPLLDAFAAQETDNAVQVVGIALDEVVAVQRYLEATPVAYPILLDRAGPNDASVRLGNAGGVLPYSVLVNASGRVLAQKLGPFRDDELQAWSAAAR